MASSTQNDSEMPRFSFGSMALADETERQARASSQLLDELQFDDDSENLNEVIDILRMSVMNEQYSPEILPYQKDTVESIKTLVEQQTEFVDEQEDEALEAVSFEVQLKRMEIDRINYMLRQYFRTRLKKIENQVLFIFKQPSPTEGSTFDLLSAAEQKFATGYSDLLEEHFKKSFLSMLPPKVRVLDNDGNVDHAPGPNLNEFVFCRVRRNIGSVTIGEEAADDAIELNQGDILCIRYKGIQGLLRKEDVELV